MDQPIIPKHCKICNISRALSLWCLLANRRQSQWLRPTSAKRPGIDRLQGAATYHRARQLNEWAQNVRVAGVRDVHVNYGAVRACMRHKFVGGVSLHPFLEAIIKFIASAKRG